MRLRVRQRSLIVCKKAMFRVDEKQFLTGFEPYANAYELAIVYTQRRFWSFSFPCRKGILLPLHNHHILINGYEALFCFRCVVLGILLRSVYAGSPNKRIGSSLAAEHSVQNNSKEKSN